MLRAERSIDSSVKYDQTNQTVGHQTNIGKVDQLLYVAQLNQLNPDRPKVPPDVEALVYRVDRDPQCRALGDRLRTQPSPAGPICAIALGTEVDLPSNFGRSLFEYLRAEVLREPLLPFQPSIFQNIVCPNQMAIDELWREIGIKFLTLPALEAERARDALGQHPGSVGFGFEFDLDARGQPPEILDAWIKSLCGCKAPQRGVALAVVMLSGNGSSPEMLETLHKTLSSRYEKDPCVVVLPVLAPVQVDEFKTWHRKLIALARERQRDLDTMVLELYPPNTQALPLGKIWKQMNSAINGAWSR